MEFFLENFNLQPKDEPKKAAEPAKKEASPPKSPKKEKEGSPPKSLKKEASPDKSPVGKRKV